MHFLEPNKCFLIVGSVGLATVYSTRKKNVKKQRNSINVNILNEISIKGAVGPRWNIINKNKSTLSNFTNLSENNS